MNEFELKVKIARLCTDFIGVDGLTNPNRHAHFVAEVQLILTAMFDQLREHSTAIERLHTSEPSDGY